MVPLLVMVSPGAAFAADSTSVPRGHPDAVRNGASYGTVPAHGGTSAS